MKKQYINMNIHTNSNIQLQNGIKLMKLLDLSEGRFVKTIWNWEGIISEINEKDFRYGQGLRTIRVGDNKIFYIHPEDVKNVIEN